MGSRMGFEYRYRFRVDNDMISEYSSCIHLYARFLFEIRTNFIIKGKLFFDDGPAPEMKIDSETFAISAERGHDEEILRISRNRRLRDYWMSDDEIQKLVHEAFAFAKQSPPNRRYGYGAVVPIVVDLDVCTLQPDDESVSVTMDRAIKTRCLYPLGLCPAYIASPKKNNNRKNERDEGVHSALLHYLRYELHTIRAEDVGMASSHMEACPICFHNPTVGAQLSLLECGHAFHTYCIVEWAIKNDSCPVCRRPAHNLPLTYDDDDYDYAADYQPLAYDDDDDDDDDDLSPSSIR